MSDSDSTIGWTNLHPIGRNLSSGIRTDDFKELDDALNMTTFLDSVNNTFTKNNDPILTTSFEVYSTFIDNVSVVNSTNTSSFITGILWDSSDSNPGEYNGTQDIVFITKINNSRQGGFGTYDYEIKVPANLKKYIIPNIDNSLTFYIELK